MRISKEQFFNEYEIPEKSFYYIYNGDEWEVPVQEVIEYLRDNRDMRLSLGIMKELDVSVDFIINNFLQEISDDFFEWYIKRMVRDDLEDKIFNADGEDVYFKFVRKEDSKEISYVFYQEEDGRYHLDRAEDKRGMYQGYKLLRKIDEQLSVIINESKIDFKRLYKY
jgi:hypothetical protein